MFSIAQDAVSLWCVRSKQAPSRLYFQELLKVEKVQWHLGAASLKVLDGKFACKLLYYVRDEKLPWVLTIIKYLFWVLCEALLSIQHKYFHRFW